MRIAMLLSAALLSFAPSMSFAGDCQCTAACHEKCQKGQGYDCQCDHCDCKTTGSCSEGHCKHEKKKN